MFCVVGLWFSLRWFIRSRTRSLDRYATDSSEAIPIRVLGQRLACIVYGMGNGDAARRRRGSALPSQRQRDPADDTDETETISSGELTHGDRDDNKQQDNQTSDAWHHRLQSGNMTTVTPTHRRPRGGMEVVHSMDELTDMSSISAVVLLQRWWRRHSSSGQRVAQLQRLCRRHVVALVRRRRTSNARSKLHAIALHIIFLVIFTYSTLCGYAHDRLYRFMQATTLKYLEAPFTASTSGTVKTFTDIMTAQELVEWLQGPFLAVTYSDSSSPAVSTLKSNHVMGGIRIGQLRSQMFNCSSRVSSFFASSELESSVGDAYYCYGSSDGDFTLSTETSDPIPIPGGDSYAFKGLNGTDTDTERSAFFSTMSVSTAQYSLPAPAFSVVLPRSNGVHASTILAALKSNGYIDGQTRAVMLDLSLYNAMVRHVIALRFLVELSASGGAVASLSAGVAPLTSSFLLDSDHWITSACHIIVILFYVYFFLDEVLALARSQSRQWQYQAIWQRSNLRKNKSKGNTRPSPLHRRHGTGVRLLGLLCYVVTWLLRLVALVKRPSELPLDSDRFVPLRPYTETFRAAQLALSASVCLGWIELVLLLRVSLHVDLLVRAVVCSAPQLLVLIMMVALVVIGYASACLIVLGAQSSLFQSLPEALRSLLAVLLQTGTGAATGTSGASSLLGFSSSYSGEVGHDAAGAATLRTLLLAWFLLFNVFVASNLFLVVIYEGYLSAKREIEVDRERLEPLRRIPQIDDERLDAAPLHLDLQREIVDYGRALATKFSNFVPRGLKGVIKRRKTDEMQSTVLPADVDISTMNLAEQDENEDDDNGDVLPTSRRRPPKAKSAQFKVGQGRREPRHRSNDNTMVLEGMVLQLALQNEALLRAINELKQDVQSLQRGGDTAINEREVLHRGSISQSTPIRSHKPRKTLVAIPDAPGNQLL